MTQTYGPLKTDGRIIVCFSGPYPPFTRLFHLPPGSSLYFLSLSMSGENLPTPHRSADPEGNIHSRMNQNSPPRSTGTTTLSQLLPENNLGKAIYPSKRSLSRKGLSLTLQQGLPNSIRAFLHPRPFLGHPYLIVLCRPSLPVVEGRTCVHL